MQKVREATEETCMNEEQETEAGNNRERGCVGYARLQNVRKGIKEGQMET